MGQKPRYIVGFFQNRQRSLPRCAARGVVGLIEDDIKCPCADILSPACAACQQLCQPLRRQRGFGRHAQQGAGRIQPEADLRKGPAQSRQPGHGQHDVAFGQKHRLMAAGALQG